MISSTQNFRRRSAPASWLLDRIKELRTQSAAAERAVVDFKKQNDIVDTGPAGGGPAGTG